MIHYYIVRGGAVIADGICAEDELHNVDLLGGEMVFDTTLPKATMSADATARVKRSALLEASDWTQLPDVPLETKAAWAEYRQALRDITEQPGYPFDIVWPTPPQ